MTADEFNEKYKDYLEKGHYGLDLNSPNIIKYLDEMFQGLIEIPGFKYSQIKEKFGSSRFYTNLYQLIGKSGLIISNKIESDLNLLLKYQYEN
jgi:hypothetical protein